VLRLIRQYRAFFLGALLAGLALRLFFVVYFPAITDDSRIYADLGSNWLQHGTYGQSQGGRPENILPTDARLPGYPAFLAGIFFLFGAGNFEAVLLAQVLIDLATCLIIADLARRTVSNRASKIAFVLAALCPFLADYAAAVLTETLEIFFTALALDLAVAALDQMKDPGAQSHIIRRCAAAGAAIAACILLRPDGGILLVAVVTYVTMACARIYSPRVLAREPATFRLRSNAAFVLIPAFAIMLFALAPLAPWTLRNFHTLHHFQPLAPRYANETDELVPKGFNRWVKTWIVDYVSVQEIYWNVPGDKIDAQKLPGRAFSNSAEKDATLAILADYNESQDITPEMDAHFEALAGERIRAHPLRYYLALPCLRIADMWLRPRTELLPPDPRWWEFNEDAKHSSVAIGFGLLNLLYVAAAVAVVARRPSAIRWAGLLIGFLLLRSAFLGTLENPEPRYTLEGYPALIVMSAALIGGTNERDRGRA
jgi:hypothetical protein